VAAEAASHKHQDEKGGQAEAAPATSSANLTQRQCGKFVGRLGHAGGMVGGGNEALGGTFSGGRLHLLSEQPGIDALDLIAKLVDILGHAGDGRAACSNIVLQLRQHCDQYRNIPVHDLAPD
jgi:hypothetical protein